MATQEYSHYVGVRLQGASKSYYFGTDFSDLKVGDYVVVETVSGLDMGAISNAPMPISLYSSSLALKPILRKPTQQDLVDYRYYEKQAKVALDITATEIRRLGLDMNLLSANYTLDGAKITITYTADSRVDFRELLRLLAPQLHCRIELHQIASRDKAKMVGGISVCGLPLCCSTFINEFDGISISRAKNQMLTLNIPKLSGPCGKLICCLLYEDDMYTEAKKSFPHIGTVVRIGDTDYTISNFNVLNRTVKLDSPLDTKMISLDEYNDLVKRNNKANRDRPGKSIPQGAH